MPDLESEQISFDGRLSWEDGLPGVARRERSCQHEGPYFFDKNVNINKEKEAFLIWLSSVIFTRVFVWVTFAFIFYCREYYFLADLPRKHL